MQKKRGKYKIVFLYHAELRAPSRCDYSSSSFPRLLFTADRRQYVVFRLHCPINATSDSSLFPFFMFFVVVILSTSFHSFLDYYILKIMFIDG
jgi:hypothetical protein